MSAPPRINQNGFKTATNFSDLTDDLQSVFKSYTGSRGDSVDSLDSEKHQAGSRYVFNSPQAHQPLPAVHISSRLSSLENHESGEEIARTAPQTPTSINSFDFRPRYPRAVTNSSLNVLLDTPSVETEFRRLVDSAGAPAKTNRYGATMDNYPDGIADGIADSSSLQEDEDDQENWDKRGAAVRSVHTRDGGTTIIRRSVKDFQFGKELGEGSYSTVMLATDKITSKQYAIKVLDKRHIIKEKKVKYVNIEKHALNRLSNRLGIISLYFTFQDKESLYFVLDYASNGELLTLIKKYNTLNEKCTRHFGAQILDAIKYMHDNGVIHRDIKPENILLDDKMRIQITDFGTARLLEKKSDESEDYPVDVRAKSFVGTAEYVSPELLESKFCGKPGDIWAFGCIIYQMIAGKPPFRATNEYLTFQKITKLQYAFSAGFPNIIRDLIKRILVLQPSKRATIPEIQEHFFFQSINFDSFDEIWLKPPPELGPYKMSAKSMMKVPNPVKAVSSIAPKKRTSKPTSEKVAVPKSSSSATSGRTEKSDNLTSVQTNPATEVNAANAAAVALRKPSSGSEATSSENVSFSKENSSESRRSSRGPDYIPGTNILRPQINTRPSVQSYSRASTREKSKTPSRASQKPDVMQVTEPGTLEAAWGFFLTDPDERVIRVGPVIAHRESTEAFNRKHRGSLHASPLDATKTPSNRSGTSLLSQMVNGIPETSSETADETVSIQEPADLTVLKRNDSKRDRNNSDAAESIVRSGPNLKNSIFKKLGLSQAERKESSAEEVNPFSLEKNQTGTLIVTTHGRALLVARENMDSPYKLILEIKLSYPFIHFQELVSPQNKFSKFLPTVGVFVIASVNSSYVFEVEKYDVSQWTEALAKAKNNETQRQLLAEQGGGSTSQRLQQSRAKSFNTNQQTAQVKSPKLSNSSPAESKSNNNNSSSSGNGNSNGISASTSARKSEDSHPKSPKLAGESSKQTSMLKSRILRASPRRKPPPVSPPNELNSHTGLPKSSADTGQLHAAQLAVSQNAHVPLSDNRRSSFTKETGTKIDTTHIRHSPSSGSQRSPIVTGANSKFLARSHRK